MSLFQILTADLLKIFAQNIIQHNTAAFLYCFLLHTVSESRDKKFFANCPKKKPQQNKHKTQKIQNPYTITPMFWSTYFQTQFIALDEVE